MSHEVFFAFISKQDSVAAAVGDVVIADHIMRIVMPDGDTHAIALENVFLGQTVTNTPAEKDADIVPLKPIATHDRTL